MKRPIVTLSDLESGSHTRWVRVTDLMAITGWSRPKVISEIAAGRLRSTSEGYRACHFIRPADALEWLYDIGLIRRAS